MAHAVDLRPRACDDIRRNAGWLARHVSPQSAARWHAAIDKSIRSLATNPERCPEADEASILGIDLRVLFHGRKPQLFRVLFTIDTQTVTVHRILHAAQDYLTADDI